MPRPNLNALDQYPFCAEHVVRIGDVNYANHLGHDALVSLLHDARVRMVRELGCSELDLGDGRTGIIMTDLCVSFAAEAFVLDRLTVESGVSEVSRSSYRVHHRVRRGAAQIALAECGQAAFDYPQRKLSRFPEAYLDRLRSRAG